MANRTAFLCHNCGQYFPWEMANRQETVNRGTNRYICMDCARVKSYGTGNVQNVHIPKKHNIGIGFELECLPHDHESYCSMISVVYKLVPTRDGSLPEGGVEFNTPVYRNMSGLKQMFRSFEQYADFSDESCGHHINVSHAEQTDRAGMRLMREYARNLFDPLMYAMQDNTRDTIRIWGRDFTYYANDNSDYSKRSYSWLNLDASNRVEFRLAKFVDAKQYLHLAFLCREILETVCTNFLEYRDSSRAELLHKSKVTGKKLVRVYQKYIDGTAKCQRPERNSK